MRVITLIIFSLLVNSCNVNNRLPEANRIIAANQDVITSWNENCSQFHFAGYPAAANQTFFNAYSGPDFIANAASLDLAINEDLLYMEWIPIKPSDSLNDVIESY